MSTLTKVKIKFPIYRFLGGFVPNETLWVCDTCGKAEWASYGGRNNRPYSHICGKNWNKLYRRATEAEKVEGLKVLAENSDRFNVHEKPVGQNAFMGSLRYVQPKFKSYEDFQKWYDEMHTVV